MDDNLGAAGLHLSEKETALLTEAIAPIVAEYPHGAQAVRQRDRTL